MNIESPARVRERVPAIGGDALAEGLMLVRASTLKVVRLQLAMERRDRRVAIEAVDDLVALDRILEGYLADVPLTHEQAALQRALETERAALNREKLTLAAEVVLGRHSAETPAAPAETVEPPPDPIAEGPVGESVAWEPSAGFGEEPPRRTAWWVVAVLVLVALAAASAFLLLGPGAAARLNALLGVAS